MSTFQKLSAVDIKDKVEKKNKLDYLSWANAWGEVKKLYPDVQRRVYESEDGLNYFHDHKTAWVKVGVTIEGVEHIDYLPIMDFRNKSVTIENITSFDVNKAIQRSTTKALALHGLGLSLYTGEDLVDNPVVSAPKPSAAPVAKLQPLKKGDANWSGVVKYVTDNKAQGLNVLVKNLKRKYNITKTVKDELRKITG